VVAAWNLAWNNREDEALKLIERAMRLNPQSPFWYFGALGDSLLNAERFEEAIEAQNKCVEAIPDFLWCQLGLALANFDYGDLENAKSHVSEALRINPALSAEDNAYVRGVPPSPERERVIDALRQAGLP
jgi:tetratricopeptide (TPR) repeat protein